MDQPRIKEPKETTGQVTKAAGYGRRHERCEAELLLEVLRPPGKTNTERVRQLVQSDAVDWNFFLRQTSRHGVSGLVHDRISRLCDATSQMHDVFPRIPEKVLCKLEEERRRIMWSNMNRMQELLQVVKSLGEVGIPVLPFKGPVLADRYYADLAFRQYGDIDLFVLREDMLRTKRVLLDRGYAPYRELTPSEETAFIDSQMAYEFVHPDSGVIIEVHWALLHDIHGFRLQPETVWERKIPLHIGGYSIQTFAPRDLIIYLAAHGSKHGWYRLLWACDMDRVVRTHLDDVNWQSVLATARSVGGARALRLGLFVANRWLRTPIPLALIETVQADDKLTDMTEYVEARWLFADIRPKDDTVAARATFLAYTRERLWDRWAYYKHLVGLALKPTEKDRAMIDLPPKLSFLYYAVRPFRLARDWTRGHLY